MENLGTKIPTMVVSHRFCLHLNLRMGLQEV